MGRLRIFGRFVGGRIVASHAVYPLYRMIGTAAAGGIVAVPTSQTTIFINKIRSRAGRAPPLPVH